MDSDASPWVYIFLVFVFIVGLFVGCEAGQGIKVSTLCENAGYDDYSAEEDDFCILIMEDGSKAYIPLEIILKSPDDR